MAACTLLVVAFAWMERDADNEASLVFLPSTILNFGLPLIDPAYQKPLVLQATEASGSHFCTVRKRQSAEKLCVGDSCGDVAQARIIGLRDHNLSPQIL